MCIYICIGELWSWNMGALSRPSNDTQAWEVGFLYLLCIVIHDLYPSMQHLILGYLGLNS